jgi:hypothetical protein
MVITAETTRADLEDALRNLVATARRLPAHYVDRRAELHAEIDALIDDWLAAPA